MAFRIPPSSKTTLPIDRDLFQTSFATQGEVAGARDYLLNHPQATFCHHPGWEMVLLESYGKQVRFLQLRTADGLLAGVAPVVDLSNWLFGKHWVALPYLDYGGPLANNPDAERILVESLIREASSRTCALEIRSSHLLPFLSVPVNEKRAMVLSLENLTEEEHWKKLNFKVRNHVRKAEKSGVTLRFGATDQLDGFYPVFCANMRELGSPVHSRKFFEAMLTHIPGSEIVTAWRKERCIGGLVRIRFRDTMATPLASTLREERIHSSNSLLYYQTIQTAFREGLGKVDFGRSSVDEGTYKFKVRWLAEASPLPWYSFRPDGKMRGEVVHAKSSPLLRLGGKVWGKLPLPLVNRMGPLLRPYFAA